MVLFFPLFSFFSFFSFFFFFSLFFLSGTLARKSRTPRSYHIAQHVIAESEGFLGTPLIAYMNSVLNGTDVTQSDVSDYIHALIYELLLIQQKNPEINILLTIIPIITDQLQATDASTRRSSTSCLGKLFHTDKSLIRSNRDHFKEFLKRQTDSDFNVRSEFVKVLGRLIIVLNETHYEEHGMIKQIIHKMFQDKDSYVRLTTVRTVSQTSKARQQEPCSLYLLLE